MKSNKFKGSFSKYMACKVSFLYILLELKELKEIVIYLLILIGLATKNYKDK